MKSHSTFSALLAVVIVVLLGAATAQARQGQPLYIAVECMKAKAPNYQGIEVDVWQPIHEERVRRGEISSWALYFVLYGDRSKCDYYTVTTILGNEQLNNTPDFEAVFGKVHPDKDLERLMAATWQSRQHAASELWEAVDATGIGAHRFATVNRMRAIDPDAYERMESRVFKPGHQALVEAGHRAGWAMYRLVTPVGTSIPYDYSTFDFSNKLSPVPMAEAMLSAHPDRDLDAIQALLDLREQVSSETWLLIATTQPSQQ